MLKFRKGALRETSEEPILPPSAALEEAPRLEAVKHVEAVQESWQMLLAKALAAMPPDVLAKVVGCIPREVFMEVLKARESDPVVKLALVLLNAQRQA
mgnify:CR=1 FL=1